MDKAEPSVTQILGANGACPTLTHGDKTWTVGHPTQAAKSELELLVIACAKENVERLSGFDDALYAKESASLSRMIRSGAFKTWGALWVEMWEGPDQIALMLSSMIRVKHKDFTLAHGRDLWINQTESVVDALSVVMPDFFLEVLKSLPCANQTRRVERDIMLVEMQSRLAEVRAAFATTTSAPSGSSTT